jgi:hypothetical protein
LLTTSAAVIAQRTGAQRLSDPDVEFILRDRDAKVRIVNNGCHLSLSEVEPKVCIFGDTSSGKTLVLFGDSHAAQWFEVLDRASREVGWRLFAITKSGCPSVSIRVWLTRERRRYTECDRWRLRALAMIESLKPTAVAVANSSWHQVESDGSASVESVDASAMHKGLNWTLERIPASSHVFLLADSPNPLFDVPDCLFRNVHRLGRCDFRRDMAIATGIRDSARSVAQKSQRVTYVDLTDHLCGTTTCSASRGDTALYRDADHLTVRFTLSLTPTFESLLRDVAPRTAARRN